MKTKYWNLLLFAWLGCAFPLQGEVEEILLTWNAFKCQDVCIPLIERNFGSIREVNNLQINAPSGIAVMGWNPNYPFSYEPFRYAAAAVGININTMRLRVRGMISHDEDNVYLVSNGDDARFLLIGPIHTEPGRYIPNNLVSYPLSSEAKEQLLSAEKNQWTVVVSGPLFFPSHYPRTLITEQIKVNIEQSQMDLRYQR